MLINSGGENTPVEDAGRLALQFHRDGFRPGDPDLAEPANDLLSGDALPETADVLIVGCGPAGLTLAAQLAAFPEIKTCIVEQKPGPLQLGQADGVACRTMEMFEAFGFRERVEREAYWVNETAFWKPDEANRGAISRHGLIQDVEDAFRPTPTSSLTRRGSMRFSSM